MKRRMLVAGNWKMNDIASDGDFRAIAEAANDTNIDVAMFPPATLIARYRAGAPAHLFLGGQDCHAEASGPFTGWLSARMLLDAGASMVIVGHSERRTGAGESDADVKAKAEAALANGLRPIICVGESAEVREAGGHVGHVLAQVAGSLPALIDDRATVAYEPVWAIGTGKTATADDVAEMHAAIRHALIERFGDVGAAIRILYGGSVNGANAAALFAIDDVDGALVGGASLSAQGFLPIVAAAIAASS